MAAQVAPPLSAAERAARSVFVGNIPYEATEEQLKEIFAHVGPVVSFRLVYDRETGKPKGYGFCEYQDIETAQSAMRNLNNHDFNGRPLRVGVAAGEQNKDDLKSMQQALGGPVVESPYGEPTEPGKAPEAISKAVASLPPEQMFELMKQMKLCIQNNPNEARNMLLQNPQLAYALLQAQIVMKIVDPQVALAMLHRQTEQIPPLLPTSGQASDTNMGPGGAAGPDQMMNNIKSAGPAPSFGMSAGQQGIPTSMGPGPAQMRPMGPGAGPQGPGGPIGPGGAPMGPGGNPMGARSAPMGPGPMGPGGPGTMGPGVPTSMGPGGPGQMGPGPAGPNLGGLLGDRPMGGPGMRDERMVGSGPGPGGPQSRPGQGAPVNMGPRDSLPGIRQDFGGPPGPGPQRDMDLRAAPGLGGPVPAQRMPDVRDPRSASRGAPQGGTRPPATSQAGMLGAGGLAGLANLQGGGGSGGPISSQDQEKAALIMQVLQLSDQQIAMLPPDQRQSILILKEQISRSAGGAGPP